MTVLVDPRAIDAIVLDIEGTTTPVAFVYDVLFPFARRHLREFLKAVHGSSELAEVVVHLQLEWADDVARGNAPPPWSDAPEGDVSLVAGYVEWLMDRDRKSPALKQLQGYIWRRGYESGELKGEVFADVRPALERWRNAGIAVAIYSSGSELAQRLLFGHTPDGDLTSRFNAFFDTAVGPKASPESYRRIAAALGRETTRMLFVSDVATELHAAREAGCRAVLCIRPGNLPEVPVVDVDVVHSMAEIAIGS